MKTYILCITLALLVGCASTEEKLIQANTTNKTDSLQIRDHKLIRGVVLPEYPKAKKIVGPDGKEYAAFDLEGINKLQLIRSRADKNSRILYELSQANKNLTKERNALVRLAKELEAQANETSVTLAKTEKLRRKEQRSNNVKTTLFSGLIAAIAIVAVL